MSMGVIASGLVLLRTVDPESKTPVPADFAYKQLLHSPFMGGGLWTAMALPLLASTGSVVFLGICCGEFCVCFCFFSYYLFMILL
jgi:ESS family glutamate:Na+ symporter